MSFLSLPGYGRSVTSLGWLDRLPLEYQAGMTFMPTDSYGPVCLRNLSGRVPSRVSNERVGAHDEKACHQQFVTFSCAPMRMVPTDPPTKQTKRASRSSRYS